MRIKTTKQLTRFCFNNYLIINKNKKMKKTESKKIINWFKYLISYFQKIILEDIKFLNNLYYVRL